MKLQSVQINSYNNRVNHFQNRAANNINFGFGIDYGDDDYLAAEDYVHKKGEGNIFGYFKLVGIFFYSWIKESIEDSRYYNSLHSNDSSYSVKDDDDDDSLDDQVDMVS